MGYRVNKIPLKPEDMLPVYTIRNGATLSLEFECYYLNLEPGHDPHYHDYRGWPDPNHPGDTCQMFPPRDQFRWLSNGKIMKIADPIEIDLKEEGYTSVEIVLDEPDAHITTAGSIDTEDPYIINVSFSVQMPVFEDKPIEKRFTLFVSREGSTDAVARAILSILPGAPLPTE